MNKRVIYCSYSGEVNMADCNVLMDNAVECGFDKARIITTGEIKFNHSFRKYCEVDLCGKYNKNYSCPPACGTPEEIQAKVLKFKNAIVLQTLSPLSSLKDGKEIASIRNAHNSKSLRFASLAGEGLLIGCGPCSLCEPCKITEGKPCVMPQKAFSCASAYCIDVKELAALCDMVFDYDQKELALFSIFMFD